MLSISVLKCMSEYWWTMITLWGGARQKGQSQSSNPGLACKLLNYSCLSTSLATSCRCSCLHAELQNRLLVGKISLSHRSTIFTTNRNPWIHPLTRARQTSASNVADLQPTGLFFQRSGVHAGRHKNVDNTLLINRKSAQKICTGRSRASEWVLKLKTNN